MPAHRKPRTRPHFLIKSVALLLLLGGIGQVVLAQVPREVIHVNLSGASHPFPHYWERMFGSGRAILSLRESYHEDLRTLKSATAVEYVRFHAIFHDEVGVYDEDARGNPVLQLFLRRPDL